VRQLLFLTNILLVVDDVADVFADVAADVVDDVVVLNNVNIRYTSSLLPTIKLFSELLLLFLLMLLLLFMLLLYQQ
jgi:hypothetical protein